MRSPTGQENLAVTVRHVMGSNPTTGDKLSDVLTDISKSELINCSLINMSGMQI